MKRSCLLAAAFTFLAGGPLEPGLRAQDTARPIAGSWVGVYQTYPHFIRMTLQIAAAAPGQQTSGEMRLEPAVNLRSIGQVHQGIVKVTVAFDANARTLVVTPSPDAYRTLGFQVPGFSGVLDDGRQLVGGVLTPMPRDACPFFILGRAETADAAFMKAIKDALDDTGQTGGIARPQNPFAGVKNPFGGRGGASDKMREWATQFTKEYPDMDPYRTESGSFALISRNLFRDEYFRQYFGKTFDELSRGDLTRITADLRATPPPRSNFPEERANGVLKSVERAFSPTLGTYTAPDITLSVLAMRPMAAWREQAIRRLGSVPPTIDGLHAIHGSRVGEQAALSTFWPSERKTFADAATAGQSRIAAPLLTSQVDGILASATSFAGAETIANVLQSIQTYRPNAGPAGARPTGPYAPRPPIAQQTPAVPPVDDSVAALASLVATDTRATQVGRLESRMSDLVKAESERDLQSLAKLQDGLPGLEASGRMFATLNQKYAVFSNPPAVRALYDALAARRSPMFRSAETALGARMKAAKGTAELTTIRQTYLGLPSDSADPVAGRLLQSMQQQMSGLKAAETIVAAVEAEERRRAASPCAKTDLKKDDEGPTEQEMCTTVEAILEGKQAAIASMEGSCKNLRSDSNPATALACLMGMGARTYHLSLRRFAKVACSPARPLPGYFCDYQVQFSTNVREFEQILGRLPGGIATARFVYSRGMWIMIPLS